MPNPPFPLTPQMDVQYNYSSTQNNGRITSSNDYVTGENVTYGYDALNRLASASAGSLWGESYSYDGFGNLTAKTATQSPAPVLGVSYDANNHQLGLSYDANGNQMTDAQGAASYTWNMENRLATSTSQAWPGPETTYSYDPWGRRVLTEYTPDPQQGDGGNGVWDGFWTFVFYSITGRKLMTMDCSYDGGSLGCWRSSGYYKYFGGKLVQTGGLYNGAVLTDRLGSVRMSGNPGTQMSYFPYGEERTSTPDGTEKFGTYFRDGPGQDYAEQRYYNNGTGRFWSPDPGGIATAHLANPITWNKYSYAAADPVNFRDPHGRDLMDAIYSFKSGNYDCTDFFTQGPGENPETYPYWQSCVNVFAGAAWPSTGGAPIDQTLNSSAQKTLAGRLANFNGSNCDQIFDDVIGGYKSGDIQSEVNIVNFYNTTTDGSYTQNQVSGNGSGTTLAKTLSFGGTAQTLNGGSTSPAVVLGANFFSNSNPVYQSNVLLHEVLHAYTGWTDQEIFQFFENHGLKSTGGGTEDISAWLSTDCKSTPTSLTWWNQ